MEQLRKIIHVDMDAFYASVEQRDHPELRGKPIAVGGGGRRGVISSASYEARAFGVRSAMPGFMAKELCPQLIFVKSHFEKYRESSQQIREIFHEYTDLVEPLSLDEAYLDVTENKRGLNSAILVARQIRKLIKEKTQLTASAGVSYCKFLAKIASDWNKPDGMKVILPEEASAFLAELPIIKFHGIGKKTADRMHRMGIHSGGDLKQYDEVELVKNFGKAGRHYYRIVRGIDNRPVNPERIRKSIGAERTFREDLVDLSPMLEKLTYLCGIVHKYMVEKNNFGRTLTIKIKDSNFRIITRSKSFINELRSLENMISVSHQLMELSFPEVDSVRLLGVTISNLEHATKGEGIQLEIDFEDHL